MRSKSKMCSSAHNDCNINEVLSEIISLDFYKQDYEQITQDLLFEDIEYSTVINTLKLIKDSGLFGT